MSAVVYSKLSDVALNLEWQCSVSPDLAELASVIHDYRITHFDLLNLDLTVENVNQVLKSLTGCVAGTNTDMNCYPLGYVTTTCFDLDGNYLP